jgi:S1-C subfamily serine protease
MTVTGRKFYSRCAIALLLATCVHLTSSCKPHEIVEEDIRRDSAVRAIEQVLPSVVNIATTNKADYRDLLEDRFRLYNGLQRSTPRQNRFSIGSGVIISEDGYILTSFHVVERASRIQVKLWDGRIYDCEGGILFTPDSDMALLKIKSQPGEKFKVMKLAQDNDLLLGETVLALGDPLGLGSTVTKGILSSKTRRRPMENVPLEYPDWLQTDAAINEGNSGGPLVNLRGEMIGLNVAVATNSQNIGFAIPTKQINVAISQFFRPEVTDSIWFGARVANGHGALRVDYLQPDSPAANAGIRVGDEILEVNGRKASEAIGFNRLLCGPATNQNYQGTLVVQRNGQRAKLNVQLVSFENLIRQKLGLTLGNGGLKIDSVEADGPAARAQLQKNFTITGAYNQAVPNQLALADVLSTKKAGEHLPLTVVVQQRTETSVTYQQGTVDVIVR